jgi:hypothetical protein
MVSNGGFVPRHQVHLVREIPWEFERPSFPAPFFNDVAESAVRSQFHAIAGEHRIKWSRYG